MLISVLDLKIINEYQICFYCELNDDLVTEINGIYLIDTKSDKSSNKYICENVENIKTFIENNFRIFCETSSWSSIESILLIVKEDSVKLKRVDFSCKPELHIYCQKVIEFENKKYNELIKKSKEEHNISNSKHKLKFTSNWYWYCDLCEEDSTRTKCDKSNCSNNDTTIAKKRAKLNTSYCGYCEDDSMRICDNKNCINYT